MNRPRPDVLSRRKAGATAVLALAVLALPESAVAEVSLDVEGTAGYTDNLLRVPNGDDDVPVSIGLTGTWTENTKHLSADVRGRVDAIEYLNDTYPGDVLGQLDGNVTWWAVPEKFALVLDQAYGQISTDPFVPIGPANRQNTNYLSVGPDWYIPIGERTRAYLGGRYGSVRYEETSDNNSERLIGIVGMDRAVSAQSRLGVQASAEQLDYESDAQADVDRNEAYVRYEFSRGALPELTVNAGYTWLSSEDYERSAPLLQLQLSRELSSSVNVQLELVSQFSDAGRTFAAGSSSSSPGGIDPIVIPEGGVFEERGGRGLVEYRKARTMLSFEVGMYDELYESSSLDRRRYDAEVRAERRMSQRMTGVASAAWSTNDYQSGGEERQDTDSEYRLELRRELGRRSSLSLVGLYASRSSDDPLVEFDETRLYAVYSYSLR